MAQQGEAAEIKKAPKVNWLKVLGAIGSVAVFFIFLNFVKIEGLSPQGIGVLAILSGCVVAWITTPVPMAWSALFGMILAVVLGYVKFDVAGSGFAGSTFWLLLAAIGIGACISASGLGKRIALGILSLVGKPTYKRVLAGIYITLFVIEFMIPSTTAKIVAMLAIFLPIVHLFGVDLTSRISRGITLSIVVLANIGALVIPTGSFMGVMVYGQAQAAGYPVSFLRWTVLAIPLVIVIFIATYFFMLWYAKPEVSEVAGGREEIKKLAKELPPMGIKEIWAVIITVAVIVLWMMDNKLKLGVSQVAVIGMLLYVVPIIGSMKVSDLFAKNIPWELMVAVGCIMGISNMIPATGAGETFSKVILTFMSFATNRIGLEFSSFLFNTVSWPLMIAIPGYLLATAPYIQAATSIGLSPDTAGIYFLALLPQFAFWSFIVLPAMALKDKAATLTQLIIVCIVVEVFAIVAVAIWGYTWVPLIEATGLGG